MRKTVIILKDLWVRRYFHDLFMRPGAIYWLKQDCGVGNNVLDPDNIDSAIGWDFNYFTFDFFPISWGNVFGPDENDLRWLA